MVEIRPTIESYQNIAQKSRSLATPVALKKELGGSSKAITMSLWGRVVVNLKKLTNPNSNTIQNKAVKEHFKNAIRLAYAYNISKSAETAIDNIQNKSLRGRDVQKILQDADRLAEQQRFQRSFVLSYGYSDEYGPCT